MYTPTKEELEELGFATPYDTVFHKEYSYISISYEVNIYYDPIQNHRWSIYSKKRTIVFYPTSLQDLETIIEMFKPN